MMAAVTEEEEFPRRQRRLGSVSATQSEQTTEKYEQPSHHVVLSGEERECLRMIRRDGSDGNAETGRREAAISCAITQGCCIIALVTGLNQSIAKPALVARVLQMSVQKSNWWSNPFALLATTFAGVSLLGGILQSIPGVTPYFVWLLDRMGPVGQAYVLLTLALVILCYAVMYVRRADRVEELKQERDNLEQQLRSKEAELKQVEENNIRLAEQGTKEDIWSRTVLNPPPFVEKDQRRARFVAVLNLKGGVGKTTLTANLGATLALMNSPLEVLLVDLDFQGTLSAMCVDQRQLIPASENQQLTATLLDPAAIPGDPKMLFLGVQQVPKARILVTDSRLEHHDFRTQARYFLDPKSDVRYLFRSVLHKPGIADTFDLVLFDCPPRLTTATINALTCCDYILIPTKMDERSFEAIPRTLKFLANLRMIAQPKVIGIIGNEVQFWRGATLIKAHKSALGRLTDFVHQSDPDLYVFQSLVELANDLGFRQEKGVIPSVHQDIRDGYFLSVATELRRRMRL